MASQDEITILRSRPHLSHRETETETERGRKLGKENRQRDREKIRGVTKG